MGGRGGGGGGRRKRRTQANKKRKTKKRRTRENSMQIVGNNLLTLVSKQVLSFDMTLPISIMLHCALRYLGSKADVDSNGRPLL